MFSYQDLRLSCHIGAVFWHDGDDDGDDDGDNNDGDKGDVILLTIENKCYIWPFSSLWNDIVKRVHSCIKLKLFII